MLTNFEKVNKLFHALSLFFLGMRVEYGRQISGLYSWIDYQRA